MSLHGITISQPFDHPKLWSDLLGCVLDSPDFGGRLRAHRLAVSLSQEELAVQSGLSVRAIGDLERGRTRWPHPGSVYRLADALRLTGEARAEFIGATTRRLPGTSGAGTSGAGTSGAGTNGQGVPRQLPPAVPVFAGRSSELAILSQVLTRPGGTTVITAIGGTAGVGKTALALRWGHLMAAEFPDGQLYANLRGFGPSSTPVSPGTAVRVLLEGLDVPAERLPYTEDGQLNLYRSLLVGKRMLIVLDNAHDEAQVRPLLPGSPTCRVLVTSRNQLAGLTALDAAHPLLLDVLSEAEAWDLLEQRLGADRLHTDDNAVHQIIKACAHLPLALSIVAGLAVLRPALPVTGIAAELSASQGLNAFTAGEPASDIRSVLSWSYRYLDELTARAFRLAGLHPGPNLDRYAAAALTGMPIEQAERALLTLTQTGLMQRAGSGRYSMHDLLRVYARELSTTHDSEAERRTALTTLSDYYLHAVYTASVVMFPAESQRPPRVCAPATSLPHFADHTQAREWLDPELASLVAISGYAIENGELPRATEMSTILYSYLDFGHHYTEAVTIYRHALEAAARAGDLSAEGAAIFGLASVDYRQGRYLDAIERYQQALRRFEEAGDRAGQVRVGHSLGNTYQIQGQHRQAAAQLRNALAFYRETGDWRMEAHALHDAGLLYLRQSWFRQASRYLHQALALYQKTGDRLLEAHLMLNIGFADFRRGLDEQAADTWHRALAIMRDRGDRRGEAVAFSYLGAIRMRQRDHELAASYLQRTLELNRAHDCLHTAADTLGDLGLNHLRQGHHQTALNELHQALDLARDSQEPGLTAVVLNGLGEALITIGRPAEGLARYAEALEVAAQAGDRYVRACARAGLGSAHDALGNRAEAIQHWQLAHDAYVRLGVPEAEEVRCLLDS
jgi:tetratricopeptide (TPR) repeat protein